MDRKDEEVLKKLLPIFKIEAQDHLKVMSTGLMEMEKGDPEKQSKVFRGIILQYGAFFDHGDLPVDEFGITFGKPQKQA